MNDQITPDAMPEVKPRKGLKLSITAIVFGEIAASFCIAVPVVQIMYGIETGFFGGIFLAAIHPVALLVTLFGIPFGVVGMVLGSRGTKLLRAEGRKIVVGRIGFFVALAGLVECAAFFTIFGLAYLEIYTNFLG